MSLKAKDIAQMLGVSTATVSLVINNKPGVSDWKRQEIKDKIRELGCEHLLKNASEPDTPAVVRNSVGFVVFKKSGCMVDEFPFFAKYLEKAAKTLKKEGYHLDVLYFTEDMDLQEKEKQLQSGGYQGFLVLGTEMEAADLEIFERTGAAVCVMDQSFRRRDVDSVSVNYAQGVEKAVQYLAQKGFHKIGYVRSKIRINNFKECFRCFRDSVEDAGLEWDDHAVVEIGYSEMEAVEDMRSYLQMNREQLAEVYFAENDALACAVIQALQEEGYQVPEDISVIGFENRKIARIVRPRLTTIDVEKDGFGRAAAELLINRMEGGHFRAVKIQLGTELIERDSVRKAVP